MTLKERQQPARRGWLQGLLAFGIPALILFIAYQSIEVFPTGDRHILTIDLFHQYAPFLAELRRKILSFESLFFSWRGGLGINFYALFAYYLASPLNLLLVLFKETQLSEAVLFLSLIKVGFAGFNSYLYLYRGRKHRPTTALIFSMGYALSSFIMAYSWNIMWLDVIMLLPLLAYTSYLLAAEGRFAPYVLVLFWTLVSNYYVAFFAAIFIALYFVVQVVEVHRLSEWRTALKHLLAFAGASILGGLMSAVVLWPTYLSLKLTSASGDSFPTQLRSAHSGFDYLTQMLFAVDPQIRSGLPNLYGGLLILLLLPIYFVARRIPLRQKIANITLLGFLLLSFNLNYLDFMWHGFHYPNQLPYRYAFVVIFLMMVMAADAFRAFHGAQKTLPLKAFGVIFFILLIVRKIDREGISNRAFFLSLVILAVYVLFLLFLWRRPRRWRIGSYLLLLTVIFELTLSSFIGVSFVNNNEYYGSREGYSRGPVVSELRAAVKELQAEDPEDLVRIEVTDTKTVNDTMLYGLNGYSIFASSFSQKPVKTMGQLGFPINGVNSFEYTDSTVAMDALFHIRYLIDRNKAEDYPGAHVPILEGEKIRVYENQNVMPLAFWVPEKAKEWAGADISCFMNQSNLYRALFEVDGLFHSIDVDIDERAMTVSDVELTGTGTGVDVKASNEWSDYLDVIVTAETPGHYYLAFRNFSVRPSEVARYTNEERFETTHVSSRNADVIDVGYLEEGEEAAFKFVFDSKKGLSGTMEFYAAYLDDDLFKEAMEEVKAQGVKLENLSANGLEVSLDAPEKGYLFVSTTYDPGWEARINGSPAWTDSLSDCFLMVPVAAGQQVVSLQFIPSGFKAGLFISLGALFLFVCALIFEIVLRQHSRRREANDEVDYEGYDEEEEYPVDDTAFRPVPEEDEADDDDTDDAEGAIEDDSEEVDDDENTDNPSDEISEEEISTAPVIRHTDLNLQPLDLEPATDREDWAIEYTYDEPAVEDATVDDIEYTAEEPEDSAKDNRSEIRRRVAELRQEEADHDDEAN